MLGSISTKLITVIKYRHLRSHVMYYDTHNFSQVPGIKNEEQSLLSLTNALTPEVLSLIKIKSITAKCSTKMGRYNDLILSPADLSEWGWLRHWQIQYSAGIKAVNMNFNGCVVFHTSVQRNDLDDIAFKHMSENGWSAIGYHFVILLDGSIINTRPIHLQGDHTRGFNDSIGICFARNLTRHNLTSREIYAARHLLDFISKKRGQLMFFRHNSAQLQVIKQKLHSSGVDVQQYIAIIEELQEKISNDLIIPKQVILKRLAPLIKEITKNPRLSSLKIGIKTRLIDYIYAIKDCPGEYLRFKDLGLRAGPYKGKEWRLDEQTNVA